LVASWDTCFGLHWIGFWPNNVILRCRLSWLHKLCLYGISALSDCRRVYTVNSWFLIFISLFLNNYCIHQLKQRSGFCIVSQVVVFFAARGMTDWIGCESDRRNTGDTHHGLDWIGFVSASTVINAGHNKLVRISNTQKSKQQYDCLRFENKITVLSYIQLMAINTS